METEINIKGLDKIDVFLALYDGARPQGMGFLHYTPGPLTRTEARQALDAHGMRFDYYRGLVMKVRLDGDTFDPRRYDRDNGIGAAQRCIDELRKEE